MKMQSQDDTIQNIFETSQQQQNRYPHNEQIPAVKDLTSIGQVEEEVQQKSSPSLSPTSSPLQQFQEIVTENGHVNTKVVSSFSRVDLIVLVVGSTCFLVIGCIIYRSMDRLLNCIDTHYEDKCIRRRKQKRRQRPVKNIRVTRKFVAPQDSNYKVILSNASTCDESLLLDDRLGKDEENPQQEGESPGCGIYSLPNSQQPQSQHLYHRDCILSWFISHTQCPLCRYTFLSCDRSKDGGINFSNDGVLKLQAQEVMEEGQEMDLEEMRRIQVQMIIEEEGILGEIQEVDPKEARRLQRQKIFDETYGTDQNDLCHI